MSNNKIFKISIKPKKAHAEAGAVEIILFSDSYKFAKDAVEFGKSHMEKIGEDLENWFSPKAGAGTEQQFVEWKSNNPELSVAAVKSPVSENQKDVEQSTINNENADLLINTLKDDGEFTDLIEAFGGEGIYLPIVKKNVLTALAETELPGHVVDISGLVEMIESGEIPADTFANPKMFAEHFEQLDQIKLGGDSQEESQEDTQTEDAPEINEELKEAVALVCLFEFDPEIPYSDEEKSDANDLTNNQNCSEEEFAAFNKLLDATSKAIDGFTFDYTQACKVADAVSKQFGQAESFDALIETSRAYASKLMTPETNEKEPEKKVEKSTPRARLAEKFADSESAEDAETVERMVFCPTGETKFFIELSGEKSQIVDVYVNLPGGECYDKKELTSKDKAILFALDRVKGHLMSCVDLSLVNKIVNNAKKDPVAWFDSYVDSSIPSAAVRTRNTNECPAPKTTGKGEFKEAEEGETRERICTHYLESVKNHPVFIETYESSNGRFLAIANVCRPQLGVTQKSSGWFASAQEARTEAWGVAVGLIQTNIFETKTLNMEVGKSMIKGIASRPVDNMESLIVDAETLEGAIARSKESEKVEIKSNNVDDAESEKKQASTDEYFEKFGTLAGYTTDWKSKSSEDKEPAAEVQPEPEPEPKPKKETAADRKKREKADADAKLQEEKVEAEKLAKAKWIAEEEEFQSELVKLNNKINALEPGESLVIDGLSDNLYHAAGGWSKSSLDTVSRDPSLILWQKNAPVDEDKLTTFEIGKALHTAVLEPHKLGDEYAVAPALNMRTNEGKAAFEKFNIENASKIILTNDDAKKVDFMARSVLAHPTANKLFSAEDGRAEVSIWWKDPKTGIVFKCRPDWMCTLFGQEFIVDLKSVADVWDFEKSVANFRYHVQDAHYSWIYENVFDTMPIFAFCAVSKSIECGRYPVRLPILDESDKVDGKDELVKNIGTLQDCLESNIWGGFETITRPNWAKRTK